MSSYVCTHTMCSNKVFEKRKKVNEHKTHYSRDGIQGVGGKKGGFLIIPRRGGGCVASTHFISFVFAIVSFFFLFCLFLLLAVCFFSSSFSSWRFVVYRCEPRNGWSMIAVQPVMYQRYTVTSGLCISSQLFFLGSFFLLFIWSNKHS